MGETGSLPRRSVDCAVVGAGPAGLSAAIWLRGLEIPFVVIEQGQTIGAT